MFSLRSNISAVWREAPPGSGLTRIPEGRARHLGLHLAVVHQDFISQDAQSSHYSPPPKNQTPYEKLMGGFSHSSSVYGLHLSSLHIRQMSV